MEKMTHLFDSVFRGYPIGNIVFWNGPETVDSWPGIGPLSTKQRKGTTSYILDGASRVSTLAGVLALPAATDPIQDFVDWRIFLDLERDCFLSSRAAKGRPNCFPVRAAMNTADYLNFSNEIEGDENKRKTCLKVVDDFVSAISTIKIPITTVTGIDKGQAARIFCRLNGWRAAEHTWRVG